MTSIKGDGTRVGIYLNRHQADLKKSVARIASGKRLLSGADGPASLILAESLSSDVAGIEQAIRNTETDISMLQTADDAISHISSLLSYLKQVALRSSNISEYEYQDVRREVDQAEIASVLDSIDRFAKQAKFGSKNLLDGSSGASGVATGPHLEFISASETTKNTPLLGAMVEITERGTQSFLLGDEILTQSLIDDGFSLQVIERGKVAEYVSSPQDTPKSIVNKLQAAFTGAGLDLTADLSPNDRLLIYHNQFGSKHSFQASSSVAGVLSETAGAIADSVLGRDAQGTIGNEKLIGDGQLLKGAPGSPNYDGLVLRYTYDTTALDDSSPPDNLAGYVKISQNSLHFHVSPHVGGGIDISLDNLVTDNLGRLAVNDSNFRNLKEIDVTSFKNAESSIRVIEAAQNQVYQLRSKIGAIQKQGLETNLAYLLNVRENIYSSVSAIRDVDYAEELINTVRAQLNINSTAWALKKSIQAQETVQRLILDKPKDDSNKF